MKLKFFLFILAHYSIFFNCAAMEPKDLNPLKTTVNKAFENFCLCGNLYSVYVDEHEPTPQEDVWRWHRDSQTVCFTRDICSNPALLEFAAHCVAADVKNNGYLKSRLARLASATLSVAAPVFAASAHLDNSTKCLALAATCVPGLVLAVDFANIGTKFFETVDNRFAATAFTLACQKLIEEKKYKTIAAYCAYAQAIKHMPVGQDEQIAIIRKALSQDSKQLAGGRIREKFEVQILDKKEDRAGRPLLYAVETYP